MTITANLNANCLNGNCPSGEERTANGRPYGCNPISADTKTTEAIILIASIFSSIAIPFGSL